MTSDIIVDDSEKKNICIYRSEGLPQRDTSSLGVIRRGVARAELDTSLGMMGHGVERV